MDIYHQLSVEEILKKLEVSDKGLTDEEVKQRQQKYGLNKIPEPKGKSLFFIFISQFLNPLIYILIIAAIISIVIGDYVDAIFIACIIGLNAVLGAYQEWRAENSAAALRNMVKVQSRVKRNGDVHNVVADELVPGDIVLLESGHKIPADLRVLEAQDLSVEEALLTGESIAVVKHKDVVEGGNEISLGDRTNMLFAATAVQKGRGTGVVVSTGEHTQIGKIAESLKTTEAEKPPLVNRMDSFSKKISFIILGACVILGAVGYMEGRPVTEIFFMMVALGVAAIPEGLPVAMTVALSIGTRRMAKRNVIVRKLPAVEGLGSCTLIASDKTGTLTMDQQSVKKIYLPSGKSYTVSGQGYNGEGEILDGDAPIQEINEELHRFIQANILSNEGVLRKKGDGEWEHSGDAVDVALRAIAFKAGKDPEYFMEGVEVVKMVPYESEIKYSAVFYKYNNELFFAMKGAMEVVEKKIKADAINEISEHSERLAEEGFRVLAMAGGKVQDTELEKVGELNLLGLIGMMDPLRPEAKEAVEECKNAGIKVMMITGDHPSTALAIAQEMGIAESKEQVATGAELSEYENLSIQEFAEKVKNINVCARVTPLQKQRIVEAMKSLGHFVAVTGDGANDAPALKSAHIGVAMGAGTDLAKEAASIIVTDDNFASIAAGVEEGRFTFDNLRKIIYLLISTGAASFITVALAIFLNIPLPFIAVQLLWLNLVTNGIQDIGLAFEKGDITVMQRPPRKPEETIFDKLMISQVVVSSLWMAAVTFSVWYYLLYTLEMEEVHARTLTVMLMVLMQNFQTLNCRSEIKSAFKVPVKNNYILVIGIILAQIVHICASYIPGLNTALQLDPIALNEWLLLLPTAMSLLVVMELFKWFWRSKYKLSNETVTSEHD
ncbi:cation-translocating P-type ATPase [Aridibaculum aurantiacum]|uniref:cation-translocating P-type ATPase n=1 Tax=Aridibaculum aurantiacum TaxID=2810307 RepID=UPI001A963973|nr:HAD-IC family P-type ATPase [Aridibaculum aurantiacum]